MTMLSQDAFLKKYRIAMDEFVKAGLTWTELEDIHAHYLSRLPHLLPIANFFRDSLQVMPEVHSLRVRIKDPEHVIEKIIRKCSEQPNRSIHVNNYGRELTDLIGVRALHLFKDDWVRIHEFIRNNWRLKERPVANVRRGDPEEPFKVSGCKVKHHPAGYRSVHYIANYRPARETFAVEIQVRTIFEEGWSEIDHRIRYPRNAESAILSQFLHLFNGFAGSADHMGTYIRLLSQEIATGAEARAALAEQEASARAEIAKLERDIANLRVSAPEKKQLSDSLSILATNRDTFTEQLLNSAGFGGENYNLATAVANLIGRESEKINSIMHDLASQHQRVGVAAPEFLGKAKKK